MSTNTSNDWTSKRANAMVLVMMVAALPVSAATLYVPQQYETIQGAIDAAVQLDTIIVSPGTYFENISFNAKLLTIRSIDPTNAEIVEATTIDGSGNQSSPVVRYSGIEDTRAVLDGLTITGATSTGVLGTIYGANAAPTIRRCRITANGAGGGGAGACFRVHGVVSSCFVSDNSGGSAAFNECDGIISRCFVTRCKPRAFFRCDGIISNCVVTGTKSQAAFSTSDAAILNCTVTGNRDGAFHDCDGQISGCIIWDNDVYQLTQSSLPTYSLIQGESEGDGNIDQNPLFRVPGYWNGSTWVNGDYRLIAGSPCINAGDPQHFEETGPWDLGRHARVLCGRVDMGAHEFGIGDLNCDRTVNLADLVGWPVCHWGPGSESLEAGCEAFDFDGDLDVDITDYVQFQRVFESR